VSEDAPGGVRSSHRNALLVVGAMGLLLLALLGLAAAWGWRWYRSLDLQAMVESSMTDLGGGPQDGESAAAAEEAAATAFEPEDPAVEPAPATADEEPAAPPTTAAGSTPAAPSTDSFAAATPAASTAAPLAAPPTVAAPPAALPPTAVAAARHGGTLRFGQAILGEVEPEETVEYDLEVRRPVYIYFDIVFADRPATYTLYDADGIEVFRQHGNDLGPFRLERAGWYRLSVETEADIPVRYEIEFRQVGS
jgi:hypothetical protein